MLGDELFDAGHLRTRVDRFDALRHRDHLGLAEFVIERLDLAVRVAFRDMIQIDQRDALHATARQRFGRPGTDTADPDHADARCAQPGMGVRAEQPGHAPEASLKPVVRRGSGPGILLHGAILDSGGLGRCRFRTGEPNTGAAS